MNMKRMLVVVSAVAVAFGAWADTETVGGYTWTYRINGDTAEIYNNGYKAISPEPTDAVTIPSTLGGKPVTSIGSSAFEACIGLTSVTIPSGVTSIGSFAFYSCDMLDYVTVPDSVTSIGNDAFEDCAGLKYAVVPMAFGSDSEKTRIFGSTTAVINARDVKVEVVDGIGLAYTVSDGEATVGGGASNYAISQSTAGAVTIPSKLGGCPVTAIREWAFLNCYGLTSVTIPSGVTSIGMAAFYQCDSLTSVTIPSGVTSIGMEAFYGCDGLTSVTIPSGVMSIGGRAFYGCKVLDYVTVPDSVTDIGNNAVAGCAGLNYAVVPTAFGSDSEKTRIFGSTSASIVARDVKVEIVDGVAWAYTVSDGKATVGGGARNYAISPSTAGAVTIPATLGGCPVTTIGGGCVHGLQRSDERDDPLRRHEHRHTSVLRLRQPWLRDVAEQCDAHQGTCVQILPHA